MIEKIIRKLKNNPDYKLKSTYTFRDIFVVIVRRFIQIIRGMFLKPFLKRSTGLIFLGRNVTVKHAYKLSVGKNLILEDNVNIDALSESGISLGDNVSIGRDGILVCTGIIAEKGEAITIGNGTGISARVYLAGMGGITIGDDVIIGPNVQIFSENHNFSKLDIKIKDQSATKQPVIIGNNCWIGAGVIILAGVTIGNGCVIAAGSVVNKSFSENLVIGGVPAKLIKNRNTMEQHPAL